MLLPFRIPRLFALACALALASCQGILAPSLQTDTPGRTETPTLTVQWFPATHTVTSYPSVSPPQPTPEMRPGQEALLFTDEFTDPAVWTLASAAEASAALLPGRLVLSVSGPGPMRLVSLRSGPVVGDFYAQADASLSLCGPAGQFGLIFRAVSNGNHYRFSVNCAGSARLERVQGGQTAVVMEWQPSGDAPLGAPTDVRLGVWAVGRELRFFLNDRYQFSFRDPVYDRGTFGFFAYTPDQAPVAVSFSHLRVSSLSYVSPTPTPTPSRTAAATRTP